ncbi:MAG: hypothetical protein R3Y63_14025 [Eubacteriales bacterium]
MIEITEEQIDRVNLLLNGIKGANIKAFYNAINRGLTTARSQSGKLMREVYHIKQSDITSNQNIKEKKASTGNLVGSLEFAGTMIPLKQFKVTPSSPKQGTVSVAVLKSESATRLTHAYVADLGNYGVGVFERATRERESSMQLYGPSTAHMMEHSDVMDKVEKLAQETVDKRVEQEISRFLNGYGV